MNKDQVKGVAEQAKGKLKEAAGALTGNRQLQQEGRADQVGGNVRKNVGDAKEHVKRGIDKL
ncbi:CsbD family protein [Azohydromonas aeria]|uniref:CsbD family protein n=1 Tax=Azohydromonas aeria TaxID=2590212 RepID=UPI0012F7F9F1|nr:CsbD family protein [Azohydromonas aeria]